MIETSVGQKLITSLQKFIDIARDKNVDDDVIITAALDYNHLALALNDDNNPSQDEWEILFAMTKGLSDALNDRYKSKKFRSFEEMFPSFIKTKH